MSSQACFPALLPTSHLSPVVSQIVEEARQCTSVVVLNKIVELSNVSAIAFIGSSASGKTTVLNQVRAIAEKIPDIVIPKRFITRPPRAGDDMTENLHVSSETLKEKVARGEVSVSWIRHMEGTRTELYAFDCFDKDKLPLYSANNDFCRQPQGIPKNTLVVGIFAPDEIRRQRLMSRSPDMNPAEANYRLGDSTANIVPLAHVLVHNWGETEQRALQDTCTLIQSIVKHRVPWGQVHPIGEPRVEYASRMGNIVNQEVVFSDGAQKSFQYFERSPGVRMLIEANGKILLTKEWRDDLRKWDYRLPGGKVFESMKEFDQFRKEHADPKELQEVAKIAVLREIQEEVGVSFPKEGVECVDRTQCGSSVHWDLFFYRARVAEPFVCKEQTTAEGEMIKSFWFTPEEIKSLVKNGEVSEDRTQAFLLKTML